ncbi:MAG: hypothetical protein CEN90_427 [Parcubacteria group bacterium Licking1014_17]|nr:MAG: hypothetical protein CEN90_427 [Parcubacteria group bacterium Licking1014_17]
MDFESPKPKAKIIGPKPGLRYIYKTLELLSPETDEFDNKTRWTELHGRIKPFENINQLSDNVREVVRKFISKKVPLLSEKIPFVNKLDGRNLLNALANNWFEEIGEEVSGKRREVLLSVMAHMVKRIETTVYKKFISQANPEELKKIGIDASVKDLLVDVLEASIKADPLFIRFLAFSQLTPEAPSGIEPTSLVVPGVETPQTIASLFPHETHYISKKFSGIALKSESWINLPGGQIFKNYAIALSELFKEENTEEAAKKQDLVKRLYAELVKSEFPIIITPGVEGYYKEPYFDPELKISISSPDSRKEEEYFHGIQASMSDSLSELNVEEASERMKKRPIRVVDTIGAFGVNLIFNVTAQEDPVILMYLNEQIRACDKGFHSFISLIENSEEAFNKSEPDFMEKISRANTILHELSHSIFPEKSKEAKRLGEVPETSISEIGAEIFYRPLVPEILEKGGMAGTREQWAIGMLASSLQVLKDNFSGDPYYYAAVYSLNDLFEKGTVVFDGKKLKIIDFDLYYQVQKTAAKEVVALYRNPEMTESKAKNWITRKCRPNEHVNKLSAFLEKIPDSDKEEK